MTLETGIRGEQSVLVTAANTAKTMGSGTLDVWLQMACAAGFGQTVFIGFTP